MVSFKFLSSALAAVASLSSFVHADESWGSFTGQVTAIDYIFDKDYSLLSELIIALNQNWTLADLQGRTNGQIANKTIAYNTVDSKYYAKIGYSATAINVTDTQVCFEPVPIQISLNENVNNVQQGRIVNGFFFIGCVDKSTIIGYPSPTPTSSIIISTTSHASTDITTISSGTATSVESSSTTDSPVTTTSAPVTSHTTLIISTISSDTSSGSAMTGHTGSIVCTDTVFVTAGVSSTASASVSASKSQTGMPVIATVTAGPGMNSTNVGQVSGAAVNSVASIFTVFAVMLALIVVA